KDYAITMSYGRFLTERFSIGATLKLIDELYEEERATGWGADIATMYNTGFRNFKIGMVMSNFGPDMKFIKEEYPLPISFKFGTSIEIINFGDHKTTVDFEVGHPNDNLEKFNGGMEYWYRDMIALRIGAQTGYDEGDLSLGAGLKLPFYGKNKLKIDYGYHDFGYLSEVHRFTLNIGF
ncbi:MAG: PorV/PorQ family protein, partial [candidate division Zixibacteria bacterium]|nr:PorV/PorQ family protein [candidate division Zixibacteria bacterium]